MDKITLKGLNIFAKHGVYEEERILGQHFIVDVVLYQDTRRAGVTDALEDSTDYGKVAGTIEKVLTSRSNQLIEACAEQIAQAILIRYPHVEKVQVELHKPQAPVQKAFTDVSVCIERGWHEVFIALGSNMGDREEYLKFAVDQIGNSPLFKEVQVASVYESAPYGDVPQGDFLNSALRAKTLLLPEELLDFLQQLENAAGRIREIHWGPRTLDLDILLYDDQIIRSERLSVPHPDMTKRDFVLLPLAELAPWKVHPVNGKTMMELWEAIGIQNIRKV